MNKTSSSKLSAYSRRPDSMRQVYKNIQHKSQTIKPESIEAIQIQKQKLNTSQDLSQLREYVKSRMLTQGNQNVRKSEMSRPITRKTEEINTKSNRRLEKIDSVPSSIMNTKQVIPMAQTLQLPSQLKTQIDRDILTLQNIQARMQNLMEKRLRQCLLFKRKSDWKLEEQFLKLSQQISTVKETDNPQNVVEDIKLLDRKIYLLEKLIAENMTEADIVRRYFLAQTSKHNLKISGYKPPISVAAPVKTDQFIYSQQKQAVVISSSNQTSYQRPNKLAYSIYKHNRGTYDGGKSKQPLPRSSYKRQYLIYGASPSSAHKPSDNLLKQCSPSHFDSTYRQSFVAKTFEKIDVKALDACKDKFKNLPVIFGRREKQQLITKYAQFLKQKKERHAAQLSQQRYLSHMIMSESRRQFRKSTTLIPSHIKHQNLHNLKYHLKTKAY